MDYDKAVEFGGPSEAIKQHCYTKHIRPLLKCPPSSENQMYLLDMAWTAFKLNIKQNEINKVLFVGWICEELVRLDQDYFIELVSGMQEEIHDKDEIVNAAERNFYNSSGSGDLVRIYSDMNKLYHVLFESEFRLWGTIPYLYVCRTYHISSKGFSEKSLVQIGASKKISELQKIKTSTIRGNPNELTDGFNVEIRNAGGGHDTWEVTDNGKILFKILDPWKGVPKGSKEIELSIREYNELITRARKTIWILEIGLVIFLINNASISGKINPKKKLKISEIKKHLNAYAEKKWLSVTKLSASDDRKIMNITIKNYPQHFGGGGQLYVGKEAAYDIVDFEENLSYKYQTLYIMQVLVRYFCERGNLPSLIVQILTENDSCLAELEYKPAELEKLYLAPDEKNMPIPTRGQLPEDEYTIIWQFPVPIGQGGKFRKKLTSLVEKLEKGRKFYK